MVSARVMVFKATFNNIAVISWQSVLLVEETGVHWENHRLVANHWQTQDIRWVIRIQLQCIISCLYWNLQVT